MATTSKLAVILHADVVESSALVHIDERVAHDRIRDAFTRASAVISAYCGHTHELRGDALLAEFQRPSDAVTAALAIQAQNADRNRALPDEIRPLMRIGLAMGEVVIADSTITGPGVVLAQRLEQLAEPGGVCLQGSVQESVPRRLPFDYQHLGSQVLKGFADPVQTFSVAVRAGSTIPLPEVEPPNPEGTPRPRYGATAVTVVAGVLVVVGLFAWLGLWPTAPTPSGQPSIAVLPFSNLSDDPEQDYFGEGIAEDIITDLSKLPDLLVIARNSSFSYQGKHVPIKTIAKELGVSHVLEGSVRRAGDALRINAKLIEADTEGHVWAERYDGDMNDVFALQDEITKRIVDALSPRLGSDAQRGLAPYPTDVAEAYDAFLRGQRHINVRAPEMIEHVTKAREEFQQAIDMDPGFSLAYAGLAWAYWNDYAYLNPLDSSLRSRAFELAERSLALSDNSLARRVRAKQFFAPEIFGYYATWRPDDPTQAISELRRGIALEPNNADALAELAYTLVFAGQPEEATRLMSKAVRLNPNFPPWYHRPAGMAHYLSGDYGRAVSEFESWHEVESLTHESVGWLAAALAQAGDVAAGRELVEKLPSWSNPIGQQTFANVYRFTREEDRMHLMEGLEKSGLRNLLED